MQRQPVRSTADKGAAGVGSNRGVRPAWKTTRERGFAYKRLAARRDTRTDFLVYGQVDAVVGEILPVSLLSFRGAAIYLTHVPRNRRSRGAVAGARDRH